MWLLKGGCIVHLGEGTWANDALHIGLKAMAVLEDDPVLNGWLIITSSYCARVFSACVASAVPTHSS